MNIDRLFDAVAARGHVCVGLDTALDYLPPSLLSSVESPAQALLSFNRALVDATLDVCACYKVQIAYYEELGLAGLEAFAKTLAYIREKGGLAISDIKRGDIADTATRYARGHFAGDFETDFVTLSPYMGMDSIEPWLDFARESGKGMFVLVRTSNKGYRDFEQLELAPAALPSSGGKRVYDAVASRLVAAVRLAMRVAYQAATAVVAVSQGVGRSLQATLGLAPERVTVIANPVITERVAEGAAGVPDHPWFHDGGDPVVVGVGRLVEQKGFDTLVRAVALANERAPCRLLVLGEGPLRAELTELAASLGVAERLALPGFAANPFPYMRECELFVLSSRWEGLPNVLIQAMAVGAKVVATDCPSGPDEILDGGRHGRLVPVDDVAALADAIVEGLSAPRRPLPPEWRARYEAGAVLDRYLAVLGLPPCPQEER